MSDPRDDRPLDDERNAVTPPGTRRPRARVVVADDDGDMRELVTLHLTAEGYDVHAAVSGADLLSILESIRVDLWPLDGVDLIVVDNRMPEMTGLEAIRRLRAARWDKPAILMTAFPAPAIQREAARLGVPVLSKPFSLDLVSSAVSLSLGS